jgi:formylglycine-generating enzyme required for sulfatase activity
LSTPRPEPGALELFAGWLSARESGDGVEFAELQRRHPRLAPELEELHATWKVLAAAEEVAEEPELPSARISRLTSRGAGFDRYKLEGEIARGGMGAILRVWDEDLRRHLAMKVALAAPRTPSRTLARFLEEAQVTGQLDHPGIVPVHELGLDSQGRLYFTMKLVEGRDLKRIFELVFDGEDGWNETRAIGVILKVCEAMAYAHKKGVIHRDLKPANIMVGSFGEVFVMDWGLARSLRGADPHDLRLAPQPPPDVDDASPAAALVTRDGDVLGTPAYMPPEQARGDIEKLSSRSDVYSIGAMLYHLLARQVPYLSAGERAGHRELLERVLAGPPLPLHELNPEVHAELAAICEKAMSRDAEHRYPDTLAFAEDLRAYLENRVVAAYETGAGAELRKWIARNRALAAACAVAIGILAVGLVVSSSLYVKSKAETDRADAKAKDLEVANDALALATQRAEEKAIEAERRAGDVLSLSAGKDLQELVARADELWPALPGNVPKFEAWLHDARALVEGRAADPARGIQAMPSLADHRRKLAELGADREAESHDTRWWQTQLSQLIADLEAFSDPKTGLASGGTNPTHGWGVLKRLESARTIEERSVAGPEAAERWQATIASIRDPAQCPHYGGLVISPQLGLLPIGRDPASGLWEFAHLQTGDAVRRDENGRLGMKAGDGLVFVLIPGGSFRMGAQNSDPSGQNFDPDAFSIESPVHEVELDAFFLSKFEMTQDQWLRFVGNNPSSYGPGTQFGRKGTTLLHPVEQVSWITAKTALARLDLGLPTEAQWEYSARAGTSTPWWTGTEKESVAGAANIRDRFWAAHSGIGAKSHEDWLDDGFSVHAPVGSYRANGFGLHDTMGNAFELCADDRAGYDRPARQGDGWRTLEARFPSIRGGSFFHSVVSQRSSSRFDVTPDYHDFNLGLRPARRISP